MIWRSSDSLASVGTVVVDAALAAAERANRLSVDQLHLAKAELAAFVDDLHLVETTEKLIVSAVQLAEIESLRGYDAAQLAERSV